MEILLDILWEVVVAVLVLMAGSVGTKIGFTFNINQWMESRRKRSKEKLRRVCPHALPIKEGDQRGFESTFSTPYGTEQWVCWRCGLVTHDIRGSEHMIERYASNPRLYFKQEEAFDRIAKKVYG